MTNNKYLPAISAAFAAPFTPGRGCGCGRVYVVLTHLERKDVKLVKVACESLGLIFQTKAYYGLANAIYVGYDNCDGKALAKGEVVAEMLNKAGIPAYSEACQD